MPYPETFWDDYKGRSEAAASQTMTIANHLSANDLKLNQPKNLTTAQLAAWNAAYEPKNKAFQEAKLKAKRELNGSIKDMLKTT